MRTTLELDDGMLAAARSVARSRGVSLGRAVSDLALRGLAPGAPVASQGSFSDLPTLPLVEDHIITDDLVAAHRDDEPDA